MDEATLFDRKISVQQVLRKMWVRYSKSLNDWGGFKILHGWGIVINSKSVIGENFTIVSGTVIGATKTGQPVIGNNVSVGAHALLLGGIVIGDNVDIGAGAIVTHDIPTNGVVYSDASSIRRIKEIK